MCGCSRLQPLMARIKSKMKLNQDVVSLNCTSVGKERVFATSVTGHVNRPRSGRQAGGRRKGVGRWRRPGWIEAVKGSVSTAVVL